MMLNMKICTLLNLSTIGLVSAWSVGDSSISRRQVFVQSTVSAGAAIAVTTATSWPAWAGIAGEDEPRVTTRMGGLLEAYQDGARGLRIMAPSGWNKFEGEVGAYDIKWQDLVDPTENIKISSSPVKSTTESIDALGDVKELGPKLAAKRNAKLISASDRTTEGILFYTFDFALPDQTHQLLLLCVAKGKLWSVDASAKEKRWGKREELYKNVLGSFVPRLNAPTSSA
jgi:photosystem II oxygen-evolving enhancer protein 2